jgi:serine protease Do
VLSSRVVAGSPADKAGLRKGDIVVSVNSRKVSSPEELTRVVRASSAGQTVRLATVRDGAPRTLSVRLARRPGDVDPEVEEPEAPEEPDMTAPPDLEMLRDVPFARGDAMILRGMGRGRLGVRVEDLNADLAPYFGVTGSQGALVLEVLKDTPAERSGLKAGDVITQVGDRKIADAGDLTEALRRAAEGKTSLTVVRKGAKRTFEADLERAPRSMWFDGGRGMMGFRGDDGKHFEIHRRDDGERGMQDELRQLREELRDLRQKLEKMERN